MDLADDGMLAWVTAWPWTPVSSTPRAASSCGNGVAELDGVEFCDGADRLSTGNDIKGGTAQPDGESTAETSAT